MIGVYKITRQTVVTNTKLQAFAEGTVGFPSEATTNGINKLPFNG